MGNLVSLAFYASGVLGGLIVHAANDWELSLGRALAIGTLVVTGLVIGVYFEMKQLKTKEAC